MSYKGSISGSRDSNPQNKNPDKSNTLSANDSIEGSVILLPTIVNGPVALGDLWDCRTNTSAGNLFDRQLTKDELQADVISTLDYTLSRIKNTEDIMNMMKLSASLSVDIQNPTSKVEISGSGRYEDTTSTKFNEERIHVNYETSTYQIRVRPRAVDAVSELVKQNLIDDKIVATHFVQAITTGGKASGKIIYSEDVNDSKMNIGGSFNLNLTTQKITIKAKAEFDMLDTELVTKYKTDVSIQSQPRLTQTVTTCKQMFEEIEKLDTLVNEEQHFPQLNELGRKPINGVPIRFRLVPIGTLIDLEKEQLFKMIQEDLMKEFTSMLYTLTDFSNPEHIKSLMASKQGTIIPILLDQSNPLTKEITLYSNALTIKSKLLKKEAAQCYADYKFGLKQNMDLLEIIKKYDQQFNITSVTFDIQTFIEEGKKELNGIRASDVDGLVDENNNACVRFFSNQIDLEDWYNPERTIKILLKTDYKKGSSSPSGVFLKLYEMAPTLSKYGIEVGVAFPNISKEEFSLTFKTQYSVTKYESEEIRFMLEVLAISVDEGETISKLFYSLNASLSGLNLPMQDYLYDVPNLVKVMGAYKGIILCETYCDLLGKLLDRDNTWNFVLPIQGLKTSVEMMRFFRQLRRSIPERFPKLEVRWLVSRFNNISDQFDSPLLFVFKDDILEAVCLDHLDVLLVLEELGQSNPDLSLLSYKRMKESCLYPPRGNFAVNVGQNLILDHETFNTDPIKDLIIFQNNSDPALKEAIDVTLSCCLREEPQILTIVGRYSINEHPMDLEPLLLQFGWEDNEFNPGKWKQIKWTDFYAKLDGYISSITPYLTKVSFALEELTELQLVPIPEPSPETPKPDPETLETLQTFNLTKALTRREAFQTRVDPPIDPPPAPTPEELNAKIDEIIQFLRENDSKFKRIKIYTWRGREINEETLYAELKKLVLSYDGMTPNARKHGISKAFQAFIIETMNSENFFHIFQLKSLVEGLQDENIKSFKHLLVPLCKKYCDRLSLSRSSNEEEYKNAARRLADSLAEKQLFKTLGILGEISYHPLLYIVHQELYNLASLPAPVNVKSLIEKMTEMGGYQDGGVSEDFYSSRLELIWTNPKFLHLIRQVVSNEAILDTLLVHMDYIMNKLKGTLEQDEMELEQLEQNQLELEDIKFPHFIPTDIIDRIKPLKALRAPPNYNWEMNWADEYVMIQQFQIFTTRKVLPWEFPQAFRKNVESNEKIRQGLERNKCLYFWDEKYQIFESPWSIPTIATALEILMKANGIVQQAKQKAREAIESSQLKLNPILMKEEENKLLKIELNDKWRKFIKEGELEEIPYRRYLLLDKLHPTVRVEYEELEESGSPILRHILQQVKKSNSLTLDSNSMSKFINYPLQGMRPGEIDFGGGYPKSRGNFGLLLTRGDIQTALFHLTDPLVTHELLVSMAKTPIALPLFIPTIKPIPSQKKDETTVSSIFQSVFLARAIQNIIVPELEELVSQPRLLKDPYRFVLTLRVGDTGGELGRSSLINGLLMKNPNTFSSLNEPGKEFGKPLNRSGLLEFTWLTQTTCEDQFWSNVVKPEYDSQRNETLLLGALHGDALSFPSLFEILKPYISCYVVFWKVGNWTELKAKKKQLSQMMGTGPEVLDIILYPDSSIITNVHVQNTILKLEKTESTLNELNKANVRQVLKEAIRIPRKSNYPESLNDESGGNNNIFLAFAGLGGVPKGFKSPTSTPPQIDLKFPDPLITEESAKLLNFIKTHTIGNIQQAIRNHDYDFTRPLRECFLNLLNLPQKGRSYSMTHLAYELDYLSRSSGRIYVQRINKLRAQIEDSGLHSGDLGDNSYMIEVQEEIKQALDKLTLHTLSVQDLFRLTSPGEGKEKQDFFDFYGEIISDGFPVGIFHPTYDETPWMHPLKEALLKLPQETRIFIISTFGPKGSGKSMLLNRLFGQGFTEHSSTLGLQMRVLWLTEELREELDCDAFVVLDSEGVGSPENKIDEQADILERKLITFLLGMSNISLANVLGPSMKELSSILEIAFVALNQIDVDKLLLTPDILLVEQELEGSPGSSNAVEFSTSLNQVSKLAGRREFEIGLQVRETYQLHQIKSRNKHSELIHKISPIGQINTQNSEYPQYHKDIQRLYQRIIEAALESRQKRIKLGDWYEYTLKLWNYIQPWKRIWYSNSDANFPASQQSQEAPNNIININPTLFASSNAQGIEDNIQLNERIAKIKSAIDAAFFHHEKKAEADFLNKPDTLDSIFKDYKVGSDSKIETKLNNLLRELRKVINTCDELLPGNPGSRRKSTNKKFRTFEAASVNPDACIACSTAFTLRESLYGEVAKKKRGFLIIEDITQYTNEVRESIFNRIKQSILSRQIIEGCSEELKALSIQIIKEESSNEENCWKKLIQYISTLQIVSPARQRFNWEIQEIYKSLPRIKSRHFPYGDHLIPDLGSILAFDVQIYNSGLESSLNPRKVEKLNWMQNDWLLSRLEDIPRKMKQEYETVLYRIGMGREVQIRIQNLILLFEEFCGERLLPQFKWEVHLVGIQLFSQFVENQQNRWDLEEEDLKEEEDFEERNQKRIVQVNNPLKAIKLRKDQGLKFEGLF